MGLKLRLLVLVAGSAGGAYLGIRAHERALQKTEEPALVTEPPVDAPAGLVAEAILATPDATWKKAQTAIGGFVLLAPPTFGGILGAAAHMPALQNIVDGASPAYAVAGEGGRWVVAAHVVTPSLARSTLADAGAPEGSCVRQAGNFVLVGSDCDAVATLGPYAHRTLPTKPLPPSAIGATIDHVALAGFVKREIDARRESAKKFLLYKDDEQRSAHGGREPDLADPKPLIRAIDAFALEYEEHVTSMARAEIAIDVDGDAMSAHVALFPPPSGDAKAWVDSLEGGATAPLAASADGTLASLFWRSGPDERDRAAKAFSEMLRDSIGERVPSADVAKLSDELAHVAKARAGWAILSVTAGAPPGVLARLAANDPALLTSSIDGAADLVRKPVWEKWEKDFGLAKIDHTPGRATFALDQGAIQAAWSAKGGEVDIAVGIDANAVMASATPTATLAQDPKVPAFLRDLHANVMWAFVARPLLFATSPRSDAAMIGFARERDHAVLHARATGVLVRNLFVSSKGL